MAFLFVGFLASLMIAIFIFGFLLNRRLGFLGFIAGLFLIIGSWLLSLLWLGHAAAQCKLDPQAFCEDAGGYMLFTVIAIVIATLYFVFVTILAFSHWRGRRNNPLPNSHNW